MTKNKSIKGQGLKESLQSAFATTVLISTWIIARFIYLYFLGNPENFEGGAATGWKMGEGFWSMLYNLVLGVPERGHPIPGNFLAMMYKGGVIVPVLMAVILVLLTYSIERMIMINKASGKQKLNIFVKNIQILLSENKIEEVVLECDKQKGSLANIVKASMLKYRDLQQDTNMDKEQKVLAMQKEWEEAAALELPMLSKNLVILSTIASIAVLIGLIGTVLGMIRAFAALAQAGAPDALALATGISEALINTAFGITGSTLAIILYNVFSTRVDGLTYKMDEAGFSLVQTFAAQTKR
ncbi:MAG: MotA/TolQ/ExbB proton channel family protein [Bacteroidales bacterium]|nr:MotA/TolQ/ExbB proton channel family protein [Bacteroidales bacterium]